MNNRLATAAGHLCHPETEGEVVEVSLLLPGWQVTALESAAHERGLTAAEMVRSLLRDFIEDQGPRAVRGPLALAAHRH
jgi:hypothetical protein